MILAEMADKLFSKEAGDWSSLCYTAFSEIHTVWVASNFTFHGQNDTIASAFSFNTSQTFLKPFQGGRLERNRRKAVQKL